MTDPWVTLILVWVMVTGAVWLWLEYTRHDRDDW